MHACVRVCGRVKAEHRKKTRQGETEEMSTPEDSVEYLENLLIAKILNEEPPPFKKGFLLPHVTSVGGNAINPDIDILQKWGNLVIGYEVKWLRPLKRGGISWAQLYKGIGQTLCYFAHGVTHAYLVLGWDEEIPIEDASRVMDYCKILQNAVFPEGSLISAYLPSNVPKSPKFMSIINRCCGFIMFDVSSGGKRQGGDPFQVQHEGFPTSSIEDGLLRDEIETKRTNLLAALPYFKWDKKFLEKWRAKAQKRFPKSLAVSKM